MVAAGVIVTAGAAGGSGISATSTSGQMFIVGQAERGDTQEPVLLFGMGDYDDEFGERVGYGSLFDQLSIYFSTGGSRAWVQRVVGPSATTGTYMLPDRAGVPIDTLRVDAASEGVWSGRVAVEIVDGALPDTFRVNVYLDDRLVEVGNNLASPSAAVMKFKKSPYIRMVDVGSITEAPNNNPGLLAPTLLDEGDDNRSSITTNSYATALTKFKQELGDGAVCAPGVGVGIHTPLIAHAEANRRVAILGGLLTDDTVPELNSLAAGYESDAAGLFAPWILVDNGAGGTRAIGPEGYVCGARAKAHATTGAWRPGAGEFTSSNLILGVAKEFTPTELDDLDGGRVSAIRKMRGAVKVYGWRSLSPDEENFTLLSTRDLLNNLVVKGERALEEFVFQPIDARGQVLSSANAAIVGVVDPIRAAGGLYERYDEEGTQIDPGYRVDTGPGVNSTLSLSQNKLKVKLSVRPSPVGVLVSLEIIKVGLTSGL